MMKRLILTWLYCCFAPLAFAEDHVMYCVEDRSTGHIFSDGEWKTESFDISRFKAQVMETQAFGIEKEQYPKYIQIDDRVFGCGIPAFQSVVCTDAQFGGGPMFIINKVSGRFTRVYASVFGYVYGDTAAYTDMISVGTCEEF